ncbi:MAG: ankyrin repeat domain-containing protein, partial [Gammaproteobacteria bacterium]
MVQGYMRYVCLMAAILVITSARADREQDFLLLDAAKEGKTGTVRALLEEGAMVNMRNRFGNTPLLYAARGGHTETV